MLSEHLQFLEQRYSIAIITFCLDKNGLIILKFRKLKISLLFKATCAHIRVFYI